MGLGPAAHISIIFQYIEIIELARSRAPSLRAHGPGPLVYFNILKYIGLLLYFNILNYIEIVAILNYFNILKLLKLLQ